MIIEFWHNGDKCGEYDTLLTEPIEVFEDYKKDRSKYGYDIMWGATCYDIKSVGFADNDTKLIAKLTKK